MIGRGKRRKISLRGLIMKTFGGIANRHWTDPRDGEHWTLWLEIAGDRPVLAFGSEGDTYTVVVGFDDELWDLSNEDLQQLLDEARGPMKLAEELEA